MSWMSSTKDFVLFEDDIKEEGFLLKQSKVLQVWRRRWLVLTSQYLCSFRRQGVYKHPTEVLNLCDILSVRALDAAMGRQNSFGVMTKERDFCLVADTAVDKERWMGAVMNCCLPELACRGTVSRSLALFSIEEQEDEEEDVVQTWWQRLTPSSRSTTPRSPKTPSKLSPVSKEAKTELSQDSPTECHRRTRPTRLNSRELDAPIVPSTAKCAGSAILLDVTSDEVLISPLAMGILNKQATPKGLRSPMPSAFRGGQFFEDAMDEETSTKFQESVMAWRKENKELFKIGQKVYARDHAVQSWVYGIVTCLSPLKVQPEGKSKGLEFLQVQSTI